MASISQEKFRGMRHKILMKSLRYLFALIKNLNSAFTKPAATFPWLQGWEKPTMPDLLYVVVAPGTFALFALAVDACDRL